MEKPFRVSPVATLRSAWMPERAAVEAAAAAAVHEYVEIVFVGMVTPTIISYMGTIVNTIVNMGTIES